MTTAENEVADEEIHGEVNDEPSETTEREINDETSQNHVSEGHSEFRSFLPGDVIVLFVFTYKKKKSGIHSLTLDQVRQEVVKLFRVEETNLDFVWRALKTDLFCVSGMYELSLSQF